MKGKKVVRLYNEEFNIDIGTLLKYITVQSNHVNIRKEVINQNDYEIFQFEDESLYQYLTELNTTVIDSVYLSDVNTISFKERRGCNILIDLNI